MVSKLREWVPCWGGQMWWISDRQHLGAIEAVQSWLVSVRSCVSVDCKLFLATVLLTKDIVLIIICDTLKIYGLGNSVIIYFQIITHTNYSHFPRNSD